MSLVDERTLIGELIARPELLPDVQAACKPEDFTCAGCRAALEWLPKLKTTGDHAARMRDFVTWREKSKVRFAGEQSEAYRQIGSAVGSGAHVAYYAQRIANDASWARIAGVASELAQELANRDMDALDDATQAIERASARMSRLQADAAIGGPRAIGEVIPQALREIEARLSGQATIGLPTGYRGLDHLLAGLRPQQLVLLAARPSVGKSALAGNIAANVCGAGGGSVLFCSLEMSATELVDRMLASEAGVDYRKMQQGHVGIGERGEIQAAAGSMHDWRLHIDDRPEMRVADIVAQARRLKMRGGLDLVIVDYLQLIRPTANARESRQEQVASISRSLKCAAKSLEVPILCLAQLNRQADQPNETPRLSHLRESGSLEQDADVVLFVHRENMGANQQASDGPPPAQLIVAKQRNGPTGKIDMDWHAGIVTFREHEHQPERYDFSMQSAQPSTMSTPADFGLEEYT